MAPGILCALATHIGKTKPSDRRKVGQDRFPKGPKNTTTSNTTHGEENKVRHECASRHEKGAGKHPMEKPTPKKKGNGGGNQIRSEENKEKHHCCEADVVKESGVLAARDETANVGKYL